MKTQPIFGTTPIFLIVAMLSLAACGGGGGEGSSQQPPAVGGGGGTATGGEPPSSERSKAPDFSGLQRAATSVPRLGRRSVIQSSNTDENNLTTDAVDAVFDRGQFSVSVTHEGGTHFTLDSNIDAVSTKTGTPIRKNQITGEWTLKGRLSDDPVTVSGFGEMPAEDFPLRAVHAGGNWWTTRNPVVSRWENGDRTDPLVPSDYIEFLKRINANWIGLSVALHYDSSTDSTVERVYSDNVDIPTFSDDALRQFIREFKDHGIDVYLTLAFEAKEAENSDRPVSRWQLGDPRVSGQIAPENWPWRPDHPDHQRFVAEFWKTYTEQAVHFARIAEEEGVRMFSLGTETERLFRTRPGGRWPNHFGQELNEMVTSVREVYGGLLTYDMHYDALVNADFYSLGSAHLWKDLDLDVVGISAWFPVADMAPSTVTSVQELQARYEQIFRDYLIPISKDNPGRPVVFLEYSAVDDVTTPARPSAVDFRRAEFTDANGNGVDDGHETQANMFQALLNAMAKYPGVLDGIFWWGNVIGSDADWAKGPGAVRDHSFRGRPSEEVVQSTYETWGDWLTGGHWMHLDADMNVVGTGAFVDAPELAGTPSLPANGTAVYQGIATGGYAFVYGNDISGVPEGSHEIGEYDGDIELTADFTAGRVSGRVHSIEVDGLYAIQGGTRPINSVSVPYEIALEATSFDGGGFTGTTSVMSGNSDLEIAESSGTWGGKFSTVSDNENTPRMIAGTHGAQFTSTGGTTGSFIGVFAGVPEQ